MTITIYHNPRCSTSRNVLAMLEEAGHAPEIIEYLVHPPSPARIRQLLALTGLAPRELMRRKEALYGELGLDAPSLSDDALIEAMYRHPVLIERPIVATPNGVRLCRPKERLLEIL